MNDARDHELAKHAERSERGFLGELIDLLKHNKKWWLAPIVIALVLIAGLLMLGGTAVAPFIYTLF